MSVLAAMEIKRRLRLGVRNPASLVVTPLLQRKDALDADSVDLRLGSRFLLPSVTQQPFLCPDRRAGSLLQHSVHVPIGQYLVVPAHQTVLGMTLEYIKLPYDIAGQILTIARTFIVVETAPWIHPRYRGCLTLEIANVSNTPLLLYPGRPIAQMVLLRVVPRPPRRDRIEGSYMGPTYPEAANFRDPSVDLARLGVSEMLTIELKWISLRGE